MATAKEQINAAYQWRLENAYSNWRANKVIPYSRAYADAFKAYEKTRGDAEKAAQARAELYIAVGMIAGAAVCGLGPVAGVIASGQRAARIGNIAVANAASRLGIMNRGQAWGLMKKFTFGGLPQFTSAVWSSHGKDLVKNSLTSFTTGGVPAVTAPAAGATQGVRDGTGTQLPIEYYLMLEGLLLKARNAVANTAEAMVDDSAVSEGELEEYWTQAIKSNFIKKAPTTGMSQSELVKLANEMELALWATAAMGWKTFSQHTHVSRSGMVRHETRTNYSGYLDSDPTGDDPVLERIDKVSKALGNDRYYIMTYQQSRNAQGQTVLRSDSVRSVKQSWDDYFGLHHSAGEKDTFLEWARTYVIERARATTIPAEFT